MPFGRIRAPQRSQVSRVLFIYLRPRSSATRKVIFAMKPVISCRNHAKIRNERQVTIAKLF